jgi:hypothetical protein
LARSAFFVWKGPLITLIMDVYVLRVARTHGVSARYLNGPRVICGPLYPLAEQAVRNPRNLWTIKFTPASAKPCRMATNYDRIGETKAIVP